MKSFHNDPEIKEKYLTRVRAHAAADEIIRGTYWAHGRGCAVGCTIHGDDHSAYERELGIPQILARLEDTIFENMPLGLAKTWPERFLSAIPLGVDLSKVWPNFAIFLLTDATQCASRHPQCDIVATHFRNELEGASIDWESVKDAAYDAAVVASADDAAADDAAAAAADVAAADADAAYTYDTYASAVYASADSAANASAADADDARSKAWIAQSEKLLQLLGEAK